MILEFCNDAYPACELNAWVWHEGDCCIGCRFVTKVVIDINLREIYAISLLYENLTFSHTTLAALIVPLTTEP